MDNGRAFRRALNGWTLTRCSIPHRISVSIRNCFSWIVTVFRQYPLIIANNIISNIHQKWGNIGKLKHVLFLTLFLGCTTYIKSLPSFPEAKILKIYFPMNGRPNTEYYWKVWANNATDSLEVKTFVKGYRDVLLTQYGKFLHSNENPISGLENDWTAWGEARFELQFRVWNRWSEDYSVRWIEIQYPAVYRGLQF